MPIKGISTIRNIVDSNSVDKVLLKKHCYSVAYLVCTEDSLISEASDMFYELLGSREEQIFNHSIYEYLQLESSEYERIQEILKHGDIVNVSTKLSVSQNINKSIEVTLIPSVKKQKLTGIFVAFFDYTDREETKSDFQNIEICRIIGMAHSISEKKDLEEEVLKLERRLDENVEAFSKLQRQHQFSVIDSKDYFEIISKDGIILYINHSTESHNDQTTHELVGKNWLYAFEASEKSKLEKMLSIVVDKPGKSIKSVIKYITKSGKTITYDLNLSNMLKDPDINGYALYWSDISDRIDMERKLTYIASHDDLTRLPNRVYLKNVWIIYVQTRLEKRLLLP